MVESEVKAGAVVAAGVGVWWWWQLSPVLLLVVVMVAASWWYSSQCHNYWASQGVLSPPSLPFIGHLHKVVSLTNYRWDILDEMYHKFSQVKCFGLYECFSPVLVIRDLDLLKSLLIKDFDYFADRRKMGDQKGSLMREMMGNLEGEEWKILRSIVSPTFSSGKMRRMFPLVCQNVQKLITSCLEDGQLKKHVDMKDRCGRYSMDNIASCAFGIDCKSQSQGRSVFADSAESFFSATPLKALKMSLMVLFPRVFNAVGLKVDSPEMMFFLSVVEETIRSRGKGPVRGDFLDIMLEAREEGAKHVLKDRAIVAQCVMFLIAGYDTVASVLAFCTYLLAKNPQYQMRLRQEMQDLVQENEEEGLTYEGVMEAKFLDACVMESLRIYPPGTIGERVCSKPYRVPGTDVTVRPGDVVQFPIYSLHHDPLYWKDPLVFRPERFMPENKAEIKNFTFMPFGMGPRNCVAMRFALLEVKTALAKLILALDLELAPGHEEVTLDFSPIILRPKDGLPLVVKPRPQTTHTT